MGITEANSITMITLLEDELAEEEEKGKDGKDELEDELASCQEKGILA